LPIYVAYCCKCKQKDANSVTIKTKLIYTSPHLRRILYVLQILCPRKTSKEIKVCMMNQIWAAEVVSIQLIKTT